MSFSLGIVGLPNVGKSTLFKALTKKPIDIANYPFCTIDPNVGIVTVPDERIDSLAKVSNSENIIPTAIEFYDIAGLVKDAHKGEGLGNKFLSHIREVKAIIHVLRGFTDRNITHVNDKVAPEDDKETINTELILADIQVLEKRIADETKKARGQDKEATKKVSLFEQIKAHLEKELLANSFELGHEEMELIKDLNLLTMKPVIYVLNVDEQKASETHSEYVVISAKIEAELSELTGDESKEYLKSLGMEKSGLEKLIQKSYETLGLITYFTSGPKETRAWTITQGTKAPQAAGVIHTDFEKGFIKAEVTNWKDFVEYGEHGAKEKGLVRIEGKEYVMKDGDVCLFHFK